MVSVGQQLSLMCIGQDVRGNIKLSLKATSPRPQGMETNDVVEGSVPYGKETPNIWAAVGSNSTTQEEQNSASELAIGKYEVGETKNLTSKVPSILIRSAAECDEEEKSTSLSQSSKGTVKSVNGSRLDRKSKSPRSQDATDPPLKSKSCRSQDVTDSKLNVINAPPSNSVPFPREKSKKSKPSILKEGLNYVLQKLEGDEKEGGDKAVTAKNMKIGTQVTAKVDQIRKHGLVLDLGKGLRGMYRFEV